ncbi:copper amine oxidase N-terminal domain-containing protein [Brevibacillus sp. M2.1A]|uniref:copper amine oxidase N-terminal domain-containing protein n=1 Tax=Brevibacillus TaxID=55080 RepID=UPI00156BC4DD|nr:MULTISPECIES: copper amine oxidase N-terminal domain-containing protein [Brevibacillus]MBY0083943.1 copper amine oxidase N-terminal domain-containing protein [Brevibacillus brevis]MCC8434237.1 copper amine oxidase N-terminal domain-containing protein [Brevibacillus sp. M2.1A]MCE0451374.1 copper amine oxidase N-terminal domain-containing protein [Brevibacillus sp. AF8]UKK96665.1 copper amine oxidase N-terminal domain-containing protein [Brevibacillus brevis]
MKKAISTSLVAILLATSVPAALAADLESKGKGNGKPEVKAEAKDKSKETSVKESDTDTDSDDENSTEASTESNIKDVKLKKELIELRQELKHAAEITEDQKAKYEQLVSELEKTADKHGALEVQLELLQRTYQKGDHTPFKKLGELLENTGSTEVKAFVDGQQVKADVAPFVKGGRALVPVRAISSALKAEVNWKPETRSVEITRGEKSITLYLDKKEATVDGKTISLDTAPVLKNGRVFLPLRFISEQLNAKVEWQEEGKIVIIDDLQAANESEQDKDSTDTSAK